MNFPETTSIFGQPGGHLQPRPVTGQTCGEALVGLLEHHGVELVFGIPGVHTVELYRGLAASTLRHVTPRHEQGAGFMADGYARVTGKPGVCFIITGPGMTNIATAMAQAYADSIPMLVISSVNATHQLGSGAGRLHELPSQHSVFAGLTAFSHTLLNADELPQVLARAFAVFASDRPRPVHIEIPLDVIVAPARATPRGAAVFPAKPAGAPAALDAAADLLAGAKRPLILAGGGAIEAAAELRALAERLQAPVALTINAKGLLPRGHALSIGSTQSLPAPRALVREADVVLAVGTELGETDYDVVFDGGFAIDGKLVRIDIDAQQSMRNFAPDVAIAADAKLALAALDARLATRPLPSRDARWGAPRVSAVRAEVDAGYDAPTRSLAALFDTVSDTLPDAVIVGDSTRPVYAGNFVFEAAAPRSWFNSSTGYGTLGYGLPAAIGAQLAVGNRPVICLTGDGGLQFTLPELASAVEAAVPVIVLLWNNHGYAEIRKYMVERDIEPIGVDIYTPDFIAIARGFGCCAVTADTQAALASELKQAAARRVPTLIEIDEQKWFDHVSGGAA
ncbi:5-guanidino-2-oxopentanoate decarboxylase [Paraburkholderia sp. GAS334]|uniref:5-guanidino-2-oxopentanoate decarboxylase n=1 Tax=Paraburkholderia sp. GAS334 TaxID=3035131 RepID=UPI003D1F9E57